MKIIIMLSKIYDIENYLSILENNINNLRTTECSLIFDTSMKTMENTIFLIRNRYCNKKNIFDKYVTKEIFNYILSFFPKKYVMSKRLICKNWYQILTNDFTKNFLGPFTDPYKVYYCNCLDNKFKKIIKLNNKLCNYNYDDKCIGIFSDNGEIIEKRTINNYIHIVPKNSQFSMFIENIDFIDSLNRKIAIGDKYIYLLAKMNIFMFDKKGEYIENFTIYLPEISKGRVVVNEEELYVLNRWHSSILKLSSNGKFKKILNCDINSKFDVYGNYIYIISDYNNLIKIMTKKGEEICNVEHNIKNYQDLFVINDSMYIITKEKIYVYKLKCF